MQQWPEKTRTDMMPKKKRTGPVSTDTATIKALIVLCVRYAKKKEDRMTIFYLCWQPRPEGLWKARA